MYHYAIKWSLYSLSEIINKLSSFLVLTIPDDNIIGCLLRHSGCPHNISALDSFNEIPNISNQIAVCKIQRTTKLRRSNFSMLQIWPCCTYSRSNIMIKYMEQYALYNLTLWYQDCCMGLCIYRYSFWGGHDDAVVKVS